MRTCSIWQSIAPSLKLSLLPQSGVETTSTRGHGSPDLHTHGKWCSISIDKMVPPERQNSMAQLRRRLYARQTDTGDDFVCLFVPLVGLWVCGYLSIYLSLIVLVQVHV